MEGAFLHVGALGHHREVWLDHRVKLDLCLTLVLFHLGIVVKTEHVEEVFIELDVCDAFVVYKGLEADSTEVWEVYSTLYLNLTIAPTKKFKLSVTVKLPAMPVLVRGVILTL